MERVQGLTSPEEERRGEERGGGEKRRGEARRGGGEKQEEKKLGEEEERSKKRRSEERRGGLGERPRDRKGGARRGHEREGRESSIHLGKVIKMTNANDSVETPLDLFFAASSAPAIGTQRQRGMTWIRADGYCGRVNKNN